VFRLKNINTIKDIQALTKTIINDFEHLGITVSKVRIPKLNEHPHQWQLNTLLFLEGSIGFLAFLMGTVLVWQLMGAILARQVRQIGVLKAIGASRVQVFEIYLTMVLLLGIAASVIAIPLTVISGYAFADFVSGQLNFNILTTKLPIHMYLYLIAAGILLPILASLPALLKGTKVTAHDAINDYGIQQNEVGNKVGTVAKLPLSNSMVLALRNTMRRKKRLAITIITMALGVAIFSTGFNVQQSIIKLLAETRTALKYDVQLTLKDPLPIEQALSPFASIDNVSRIETRGGSKGVIQTNTIETTGEATVFALPWDTEMLALEVIQGRWLQATDEPEIVVNQKVLESFANPVLGEYYTLNIKGKLLKVKLVGLVEDIDKSVYDKSFGTGQLVKSLMFIAKDNDYDKILTLEGDIEKAIGPSILSVGNIESQTGRMQVLYDHLNVILVMLLSMALLVLVVGSLGMASAISINIMERTREIGVLRAIGATPKMIYGLFVTEGLVISTVSIVLGLLLAWPLSIVAAGFFGDLILNYPLKFALSNLGIVITLVATLTFGWLASRIPAVKAIRVSTREALSYE
jgi:putative ABC transport system permease protein